MSDFEFAIIGDFIEITGPVTREAMQAAFSTNLDESMRKATESMETLGRGPWEPVSHSLVFVDGHLAVTFLVRRER